MTSEIKDRTQAGARVRGSGATAFAADQGPVWINGELTAAAAAAISPFDHGLLVGDGVFETLISYEGRIFAMRRHYERLVRSAGMLGLEVPSCAALRDAGHAVLEANGLANARLRITVTGGPAPLGSEKGDAPATVIVAAASLPRWDSHAAVVVVPYTRNENGALTGCKTTSYGENVVALAFAKQRGAGEAIFSNTSGNLCEGTGSNVFLVKGGKILTPPLASGCLAGVTRALALELCAEEGISADEIDVPVGDLKSADEAFLTSTTREVQPIGKVDGTALDGVPGAVTTRLMGAFRRLRERDIDP